MKWYPISNNDLPLPHKIVQIKVGGKQVCLIHDGEKLHATQNRCPHAGADLVNGWCESERLICPYHRHAFHLETGRGDAGQGNYIDVYPLKQEQEIWYIGLKQNFIANLFS